MKTKHKYSIELENKLMYLNDKELDKFFECNTIEYETDLETVIRNDKNKLVSTNEE